MIAEAVPVVPERVDGTGATRLSKPEIQYGKKGFSENNRRINKNARKTTAST